MRLNLGGIAFEISCTPAVLVDCVLVGHHHSGDRFKGIGGDGFRIFFQLFHFTEQKWPKMNPETKSSLRIQKGIIISCSSNQTADEGITVD